MPSVKHVLLPPAHLIDHDFPLTPLDQMARPVFGRYLLFYATPLPVSALLCRLQQVLEQLPIFYGHVAYDSQRASLKGQIRAYDGVPVVEQWLPHTIQHYMPHFSPHQLTPQLCANNSSAIYQLGMPVLRVKISHLAKQSGTILAVAVCHHLGDGYSMMQLLHRWAGQSSQTTTLACQLQWNMHASSAAPTLPSANSVSYADIVSPDKYGIVTSLPTSTVLLRFSAERLAALKALAMTTATTHTPWISTVDAVTALLWRARTRARQPAPDTRLHLATAVNMRTRSMHIALPADYFGNASYSTLLSELTACQVLTLPLGVVAAHVRLAIQRGTPDVFESKQERFRRNGGLPAYFAEFLQMANQLDVLMSDFSKFRVYDLDFGQGPPVRFRWPCNLGDRALHILDMPPGNGNVIHGARGLEALLNIDPAVRQRLHCDKELLAYANIC